MEYQLQRRDWDCSPTALLNCLMHYAGRCGVLGTAKRYLNDLESMYEACYAWCKTSEDGTWDVDLDRAVSFCQHQFKMFEAEHCFELEYEDMKDHLIEDEGNTFILSHYDYQGEGHVTFITGYNEEFGGFNCVNFYAGIEPVIGRITEKRMKAVFELSRHLAKERGEPDIVGWFVTDWEYSENTGTH